MDTERTSELLSWNLSLTSVKKVADDVLRQEDLRMKQLEQQMDEKNTGMILKDEPPAGTL